MDKLYEEMNENEKLFCQYLAKFEDAPPLLMTMSYYNDFYAELIKKALERGTPITNEEIDEAAEDLEYDTDDSFED